MKTRKRLWLIPLALGLLLLLVFLLDRPALAEDLSGGEATISWTIFHVENGEPDLKNHQVTLSPGEEGHARLSALLTGTRCRRSLESVAALVGDLLGDYAKEDVTAVYHFNLPDGPRLTVYDDGAISLDRQFYHLPQGEREAFFAELEEITAQTQTP